MTGGPEVGATRRRRSRSDAGRGRGPRSPSRSRSSGPPRDRDRARTAAGPAAAGRDDARRRRLVALGAAGGRGDAGTASGPLVLDYAFVLDGDEPALPDPRSAWQPHGVHGPSRTFDPAAFAWTDDGWRGPRDGHGVLGGVVYELHVGTFTAEGTLDAAVERLDHLVALGVDVVEVMPVAAFPGRWGWGYDGVALYAVHDGYGGPDALQRASSTPATPAGSASASTSCTTTSARAATTSRASAPTSPRRTHTPWGPAVNLDHEGCRARAAGSSSRTRCAGSATSTSTPCASTPSTSSRTTRRRHYLAELSDAVADAVGGARAAARPRRRERPQRHRRWSRRRPRVAAG